RLPYNLAPGYYSMALRVYDASGNVSLPAQAYVTLLSDNFSSVRVYPSPWKRTEHANKDIIFDGLNAGSTVKIFTIAGQHVMTLQAAGSQTSWPAPLKNDHGDNVASGIYLYLITDGQG